MELKRKKEGAHFNLTEFRKIKNVGKSINDDLTKCLNKEKERIFGWVEGVEERENNYRMNIGQNQSRVKKEK